MHKILFISLIIILYLGGCTADDPPTTPDVTPEVEWWEVKYDTSEMTRTFPGVVQAPSESYLSFQVGGPIKEIPVNRGELVEKGDILAKIDRRDYENKLQEIDHSLESMKSELEIMQEGAREEDIAVLEAKLNAAQAAKKEAYQDYQRYSNLLERESIPRATYEKIKALYKVRKSEVEVVEKELEKARTGARDEEIEGMKSKIEAARSQRQEALNALSDTDVKAPFTGYVGNKMVEEHELVKPGQPVLSFWKKDRWEVKVNLPEKYTIKELKEFYCHFKRPLQETFSAELKELGHKPHFSHRSYPLILTLEESARENILPGMAVDVEIHYQPADLEKWTSVPLQALFSDIEGKSHVYVFDEEKEVIIKQKVTTGRLMQEDTIQITEGLKEGEKVVLSGVRFLQPEQKVKLGEQKNGT